MLYFTEDEGFKFYTISKYDLGVDDLNKDFIF